MFASDSAFSAFTGSTMFAGMGRGDVVAPEATGGAFRVQAVEVITAEFSVSNRLSEYIIGNDDEPVSHRYYDLLDSAARGNAIEQRSQKGIFGVRGRPSSLAQTASQIHIPLAGLAGPALPALSQLPGHKPAQLAKCVASGNCVMSSPSSAMSDQAVMSSIPGIVHNLSITPA